MALQLTGAAKFSSIANLQVRLPVVVIGGGLTAIDTATESLAYYVRQVEKFALRYRTLVAERGEAAVRAALERRRSRASPTNSWRMPRRSAPSATPPAREGRAPRLAQLLDEWGGATIAYRRRLIDAPSYTLNHEEVAKAMEEAVRFAEGLTPLAVEVDRVRPCRRAARARVPTAPKRCCRRAPCWSPPARSRTPCWRARTAAFQLDGKYFQAVDETGAPVSPVRGLAKPDATQVLMHRADERPLRQLLRRPAPELLRQRGEGDGRREARLSGGLARAGAREPAPPVTGADLIAALPRRADRHACTRCTGSRPPSSRWWCARPPPPRAFRPGQFYRLQNYEMHAARIAERPDGARHHGADHGRPGDDRRLDRSGTRPGRR